MRCRLPLAEPPPNFASIKQTEYKHENRLVMETIKGLIKSLINGGIGAIVGAAFATAFGWNEWILAVIGYILGWLLLSKSFWEGVRESKEELAEEDRREEERKRKEGK